MGQNQSFDVFYDLENPPAAFACGIILVAPKSGDDSLTELRWLPNEAKIIGTGLSIDEFEKDGVPIHLGNVLVNVSGTAKTLGPIIRAMPNIEWVHATTSGVDHILCPEILDNPNIVFTNSRGVFSRYILITTPPPPSSLPSLHMMYLWLSVISVPWRSMSWEHVFISPKA